MNVWEYMFIKLPIDCSPEDAQVEFNKLGGLGWELIQLTAGAHWFKRPLYDTRTPYPAGH